MLDFTPTSMATSPLKKNEFLELVATRFLNENPGWRRSHQKKREYILTVGREVSDSCFVTLCVSCRPDRYWFGLSVGWSPSEEAHVQRLELRENPPSYPNDGSLRRIQNLDHVRQFDFAVMSRSVSGTNRPPNRPNLPVGSGSPITRDAPGIVGSLSAIDASCHAVPAARPVGSDRGPGFLSRPASRRAPSRAARRWP